MCAGRRQRRDGRLGVGTNLDVVDPAEGGADLVLDARLDAERLGLDAMRCHGNLVGPESTGSQRVEGAEEGDADGSRGSRRASCRNPGADRDLDRYVVRQVCPVDNRLEQWVASRSAPGANA